MTRIGIVAELGHETRVAATPVTVRKLAELGYDVVVERGAGEAASFPDDAYAEAGAVIVGADEAWRVRGGAADQSAHRARRSAGCADGATLIGLLSPGAATRNWSRRWRRGRSPPWRWTPSRASPGRSRWTCSARWPTSPATGP